MCFYELSQLPAATSIYFGCEPAWETNKESRRAIDFPKLLKRKNKMILVFQPNLHDMDVIARALKTTFFEAVLHDKKRQEPDHEEPLVAYVADEFHRFVTSDKTHGEQSFLDTCRSFGAFCVLATQSTSSLSYAMRELGTDGDTVDDALSVLYNNTGTKLFFRSTDQKTTDRARLFAPAVIHARPLATLAPGECYAALVDGRFERAQLEMWRDR